MRQIKIFILIGILFLLGSAGATAYVWGVVQETVPVPTLLEEEGRVLTESILESAQDVVSEELTDLTDGVTATVTPVSAQIVPAEGIPVNTDRLTETQKAVAGQLGVDTENLVITPEMVACAESALGIERVAELVDGSTPGILEGIQLYGCLEN